MTTSDPHVALGIAPDASETEIREAYRAILNTLNVGGLAHTEIKARLDTARTAYNSLTDQPIEDKVQFDQAENFNKAIPMQAASSAGLAASRVGNSRRHLYFNDGAKIETEDNDSVVRIFASIRGQSPRQLLHKWKSRIGYAAAAFFIIVIVVWLGIN